MANKPYENFVLENKLESILETKLDLNQFMTPDYSLAENAGMKKKIHKYSANGIARDVAMGYGNQAGDEFEAGFLEEEYEVGTTQERGIYYDEEEMTDPLIVDSIVKGMAEGMTNAWNSKAIDEMQKATLGVDIDFTTATEGYAFGKIVDALALLGEEAEGMSLLINPAQQAWLRKQLREELKYVEGFVRTGYIGSVAGCPVYVSVKVPSTCMFLINREAITLFVKKASESEQERDANIRKNTVYLRKVALVALTNEKKIVVLGNAQSTACAITTYTKNAKTIAGTCGTDCIKVRVVDGTGKVYDVVPTSGAWTMSADANLVSGQKINATAFAPGYAPKAASTVTVA